MAQGVFPRLPNADAGDFPWPTISSAFRGRFTRFAQGMTWTDSGPRKKVGTGFD
jgi:hypothetical protein